MLKYETLQYVLRKWFCICSAHRRLPLIIRSGSRVTASSTQPVRHSLVRSYAGFEPMDANPKQSKRRDDVLDPTMDVESQRQKERKDATSALNAAIEAMDLAKGLSIVAPAKDVFGTVSDTLTRLRVSSIGFGLIDCRLKRT